MGMLSCADNDEPNLQIDIDTSLTKQQI